MKRCLTCRLPCAGPRCPQCASAIRRRYGRQQQTARTNWQTAVDTGTVTCSRCHAPIAPTDAWDLDHIDGTRRPAHASCNRRAGRTGGGLIT